MPEIVTHPPKCERRLGRAPPQPKICESETGVGPPVRPVVWPAPRTPTHTSALVFRASGGVDEQQQKLCLVCLSEERNATIVHGETGHIACCLTCARILKFRKMKCPVCRLKIDTVIQHFWGDGIDSCDMYYQ
uniref:RING-type domain-containing protein n=1 Tax=Pseudictyota dubia TaxID=2749911 RepID=A0A7R9Z1H2_9STRA|mmetsp:Transcript_1781/g.3057  ORF Transcript_1781/g.3057 Transcript_1781/m.3057 type:complete len:133 (+) Transcript_1781:416-814(+)